MSLISDEKVNSPYDDFRAAGEFEMDAWVNDREVLFTLPEILALFK